MTVLKPRARGDMLAGDGSPSCGRAQAIGFDNAWIVSVDAGARRLPGVLVLLIAIIAIGVAMYGGVALYMGLPPLRGGYGALVLDRMMQDACIVGPLLVFALVMVFGVERRAPLVAAVPFGLATALGIASGLGGYLLTVGIAAALGVVGPGVGSPGAVRALGLLSGGVLILFQVSCEEAFFHGWLQPALGSRWGAWVGLATTTVLFAVAHGLLRPLGPVAFVNDALAATVFGLFAYRTGGLFAPIGLHWAWNWIEQAGLGLSPNPGVDPLGSLFDLDLHGPRLLAGGTDEMNGSICATLTLLLLIGCALALRRRGGQGTCDKADNPRRLAEAS